MKIARERLSRNEAKLSPSLKAYDGDGGGSEERERHKGKEPLVGVADLRDRARSYEVNGEY